MSEDRPQIYLLTPPSFDLDIFPETLSKVLGAHEIACIRLALASKDEDAVMRAADAVRVVAHEHDVALVIENHIALVERHGLDGVHLSDGARTVRYARKELGPEAIVGAFCGASRHEGMNAGEAGADYVCFGPVGETGLGSGARPEREIFEWWSEVIEVPVVAEGALTEELVRAYAPITDFFAIGEEIWREEDPAAALGRLIAAMG
ncbi:thiamine phosphate synthase [Rhodobacter lacus]|uniref:Thiamine phosphate synthase n=1 Tax=Rhodobacter lacus TaxID=1641972 RepID=A0ABW5ACU2_9RHOB